MRACPYLPPRPPRTLPAAPPPPPAGVKMEQFVADREEVLLLAERVADAQRLATMQMKEADAGKKSKRKGEDGDDEGASAAGRPGKRGGRKY